jgi:MFS transporter, DHA1 family, multidrug resistance protein
MSSTGRRSRAYSRWNPNTWEPWQRNQWAIYASVLISFLGFSFLSPFLPQYVERLGVHDPGRAALWSGLLVGVSPLLGGILTPFWVRTAEWTGNRILILRCLVAWIFILSAMGLVTNVWQLLALRILLGVFSGFNSFALAILTITVPRERISQTIGTLQATQFIASALGPIFGGTLADTVGQRGTFFVAGALSLVASVVFFLLFDAAHDRAAAPKRKERASMGAMAQLPGFLAIMVTLVSISFIERTFGPLIPLYVQLLHAPARLLGTISGAVITIGSIAAAVAATTMGRLSRGRNPRNLLLVTLTGGCLVLIPITLAREWWQLLFLRPMLDIFIGGNTTLAYAIAARALPEQWKLTAFGTLGGLAQIGNAFAPFVAGAVTDVSHSMRTIFGMDAVLYGVLLLWAWKSIRLPAEGASPTPFATGAVPVRDEAVDST